MNPEFWAIIGVGVALAGLQWRLYGSLNANLSALNSNLSADTASRRASTASKPTSPASKNAFRASKAGSPGASGKKPYRPHSASPGQQHRY